MKTKIKRPLRVRIPTLSMIDGCVTEEGAKDVMTHDEFESRCWSYYLFLEDTFLHTTRFVYLSKYNFTCYSYEFVNLLIVTSIELENIIKIIYRHMNMLTDNEKLKCSIHKYYNNIKGHLFTLLKNGDTPVINLHEQHVFLCPFKGFGKHKNWWSSYNAVKHSKETNFRKANMWNVLNALSAVFAIDCLFLKYLATTPIDAPVLESKLFYFENFEFKACFGPMCTTKQTLDSIENIS